MANWKLGIPSAFDGSYNIIDSNNAVEFTYNPSSYTEIWGGGGSLTQTANNSYRKVSTSGSAKRRITLTFDTVTESDKAYLDQFQDGQNLGTEGYLYLINGQGIKYNVLPEENQYNAQRKLGTVVRHRVNSYVFQEV